MEHALDLGRGVIRVAEGQRRKIRSGGLLDDHELNVFVPSHLGASANRTGAVVDFIDHHIDRPTRKGEGKAQKSDENKESHNPKL
jgi:hypothetical protein